MHKTKCLVCNSDNLKHRFEKKGKQFYKCNACSFEMQYPMPSEKELVEYYDKSYDDGLYKEFIDAEKMKSVNAEYRFRKTWGYLSPSVLDVGCADGHFLDVLNNNNLNSEGIDLSDVAVNYAINKKIKVTAVKLEDFSPGYKYNSIVAFDVIEHVKDPHKFLKNIKNLLNKNGKLILSTPNNNSIHRRIIGRLWYFYIPEEHLLYFNKKTIKPLLEEHGFKIVKQSIFAKPLTLEYGLTQFKEYNPLIYKILKIITSILPAKLNKLPIPFYIGEMLCIAVKVN